MTNRRAAAWLGVAPCMMAVCWASCAAPENRSEPASPSTRREAVEARPQEVEYVEAEPGLPGRVHVVRRNETLYSLALQYYGDASQWRRIWAANKKRLADPKDLPVGMKLIVP